MTGKSRTRQLIVVMKQGNACEVKGHSQATNDTMTEPDWEAVAQLWLTPQNLSERRDACGTKISLLEFEKRNRAKIHP